MPFTRLHHSLPSLTPGSQQAGVTPASPHFLLTPALHFVSAALMHACVAVSPGVGGLQEPVVLPFASFALHFCEHFARAPTYFESVLPALAWHFASSALTPVLLQ